MDNSLNSQGTELFLSIDNTTVLKFDCPTAINGLGYSTNELPNSCLDSVSETTRPGRKKISDLTVPFLFQSGSASQKYVLDTLSNPSLELPYAIALSDGVTDPTLTAGVFVVPGGATPTRTTIIGTGYVSGYNVDVNDGAVISGTFTFKPQSQVWAYKA